MVAYPISSGNFQRNGSSKVVFLGTSSSEWRRTAHTALVYAAHATCEESVIRDRC